VSGDSIRERLGDWEREEPGDKGRRGHLERGRWKSGGIREEGETWGVGEWETKGEGDGETGRLRNGAKN
jgi:hypothetical protein